MSGALRDKIVRLFVTAMIVMVIAGGLVMVYPNYCRGRSLKEQAADLDAEVVRKRAEIAKLIENQRRFKTDPDFVEAIARQNHRVYPGELLFLFDNEKKR